MVAAAVALLERKDVARDAFALAAGSIVLLNLWLLVHATTAGDYVSAAFGAGIDGLIDSLELQAQGRDDPFTRQGLSAARPHRRLRRALRRPRALPGRHVSAVAPILAARYRRAAHRAAWSSDRCCGRSRLRSASAAPRRSSTDLAVPVPRRGHLRGGRRAQAAWHRFAPWPLGAGLVLAVVGFLVAGGIVIGDNVGGRFPRPAPSTAAGPESVTDDAIAAARWLKETSGPGHAVLGDRGSELIFGSYGDQRPAAWNGQIPFVAETPDQIAAGLRRLGATHVVVDRRITELPPPVRPLLLPTGNERGDVRTAVPARPDPQARRRAIAQPHLRQRQHRHLRSGGRRLAGGQR